MCQRFLSRTLLLPVALISLTTGCKEKSNTLAVDEQAIRTADAEWLKAVKAKNLERIVSFYADDASEFPIEEPIATGKAAIRQDWEHLLAIPGSQLNWQITKIEISRSGDLAYVQSAYQASFEDMEGKPATEIGKAVTIWKKQSDGTWKAVVDISNTDSPPPAHKPSHHE